MRSPGCSPSAATSSIEKAKANEETLMAAVLDAGGDDLRDDGDNWEVLYGARGVSGREGCRDRARHRAVSAEIAMLPQNYIKLEGKVAQSMLRLMEALDDHDDIRHVWSNVDIEEKEIEASLA